MGDLIEELLAPESPRFNVYGVINTASGIDRDIAFTITLDAQDGDEAERVCAAFLVGAHELVSEEL